MEKYLKSIELVELYLQKMKTAQKYPYVVKWLHKKGLFDVKFNVFLYFHFPITALLAKNSLKNILGEKIFTIERVIGKWKYKNTIIFTLKNT